MLKFKLKSPVQKLTISHCHTFLCAFGKRSIFIFTLNPLKIFRHIFDEEEKENFLCAEFLIKQNKKLALAGSVGIIKLVDLEDGRVKDYFLGHGGAIYDLKLHMTKPYLFSCSEDTTIRMWCLNTKSCLAIFGGFFGHKDHILTIDISICGNKLLSSGTDCSVKIWQISFNQNSCESIYYPIYSSSKLQKTYITCSKFYGLIVTTKSIYDRITFVCPEIKTVVYKNSVNSDSFFIAECKSSSYLLDKFYFLRNYIFYGTKEGEIVVYDVDKLKEVNKILFNEKINWFVISDKKVFGLSESCLDILEIDFVI